MDIHLLTTLRLARSERPPGTPVALWQGID
jgi:hypothetical protein